MDGISTGLINGVAGALAAHEAARQQNARAMRQRRLAERRGGDVDSNSDAFDAPVEQVVESAQVSSHPPDAGVPQRSPDDADHVDVTA